MFTAITNLN